MRPSRLCTQLAVAAAVLSVAAARLPAGSGIAPRVTQTRPAAEPPRADTTPTAEPADLVLLARARAQGKDAGSSVVTYRQLRWDPRKTAVIVCDMWDRHWCAGATRRVAEMAPRANLALAAARKTGVLIVHAPSGTMAAYREHPARRRAAAAARALDLPDGIASGSSGIPSEEGFAWPIDQSDGGCDC